MPTQSGIERSKVNSMINKTNYVTKAEQVMRNITNDNSRLTTTKIRKLLSMSAEIYNDASRLIVNELDDDILARIQYLRMQIAYQAGRDRDVKRFVEQSNLLEEIQLIGADKEKLIVFCHYMEALVAYHRFYGGKDN